MRKLTTEEFIERAQYVHLDIYDYSLTYYDGSDINVIIICKIHGEFSQRASYHINHKYGCPLCGYIKLSYSHTLSQEEFIEKSNKIHNNQYNYSKVNYIDSTTKVIIICKIHGEFLQSPNDHLNKCGCQICGREKSNNSKKLTQEEFIERSNKIHNDQYNYSKVNYINTTIKVIIICKIHGEFLQTPSHHMYNNTGCKKCNKLKLKPKSCGVYNKSSVLQNKNKNFILYLIKLSNMEENFYKIGITTGKLNSRLSQIKKESTYITEIITFKEMILYNAFTMEQEIIQDYASFRYRPKIKFGGHRECFSIPISI